MSRTARGRQVARSAAALLAIGSLILAACAGSASSDAGREGSATLSETAGGDRPRVAASFPILADIVANVGGDRIEVWSVIPRSADPHTYEASPQDLVRLSESDLLITVGGHLERFIESGAWRRTARKADIPVVELAQAIDLIVRDMVIDHGDHTHDLREGDPHFWLDPRYTLDAIEAIRDRLIDLDPEHAESYRRNARAYASDVRETDAYLAAAIEEIPPDGRTLVVHHDAYTYLAERFGFSVLGYVLPSGGAGEASAQGVAELHRIVRSSGAPAVFREPQFEARVLQELARDEGVTVGILLTDVLTDEAPTYLDLIRSNADSLRSHLAP